MFEFMKRKNFVRFACSALGLTAWLHSGCLGDRPTKEAKKGAEDQDARYAKLRDEMVRRQIEARGVRDPLVLAAMRKVPRHKFCPEKVRKEAYEDYPLPIGEGQTISQPYIVAVMTESLGLKGGEKVLEIGTGSGYQAAVLAEIAGEVYTMEIIPSLAERARETLEALGYSNVHVRCGDGFKGWPEEAPFDGIIVTCAPERVPKPLLEQLKVGGRLVIPVGPQWGAQQLKVITKTREGISEEALMDVRFVPMTGEVQRIGGE